MTTAITDEQVQELKNTLRFFEHGAIATRPEWVEEARAMLRLRIERNSLSRIAAVLSTDPGNPCLAQTVKNRLDWALESYKRNLPESKTGRVCQNCGESYLFGYTEQP